MENFEEVFSEEDEFEMVEIILPLKRLKKAFSNSDSNYITLKNKHGISEANESLNMKLDDNTSTGNANYYLDFEENLENEQNNTKLNNLQDSSLKNVKPETKSVFIFHSSKVDKLSKNKISEMNNFFKSKINNILVVDNNKKINSKNEINNTNNNEKSNYISKYDFYYKKFLESTQHSNLLNNSTENTDNKEDELKITNKNNIHFNNINYNNNNINNKNKSLQDDNKKMIIDPINENIEGKNFSNDDKPKTLFNSREKIIKYIKSFEKCKWIIFKFFNN